MNSLYIDSADNNRISVVLEVNGQKYEVISESNDTRGSQVILPTILGLLNKHNLRAKDIQEIRVNKGPGSFTGLRVGVAIANSLAYALNVPVNKKPVGEFVVPEYS